MQTCGIGFDALGIMKNHMNCLYLFRMTSLVPNFIRCIRGMCRCCQLGIIHPAHEPLIEARAAINKWIGLDMQPTDYDDLY